MSKELIEKLREAAEFLGGRYGEFMSQAADALEAKTAPVGELRQEFEKKYPAAKTLVFCAGRYDAKTDSSQWKHAVCAAINQSWDDYQAGAAYQRAQQPQSAEADGEVVVTRTPAGQILAVTRQDDEGRVLSIIAQSVPVVVPERKQQPDGFVTMPSHYEGWNACLDEFARLNGKEVGRG